MIQNIKQSGFGCFLAWLVTLSPETERISIIILYIIQYVHYLRFRVHVPAFIIIRVTGISLSCLRV